MALRHRSDLFALQAILCALLNCLKCILTRFKPDVSAAYRATPRHPSRILSPPPGTELSNLYQGTLISGYLLSVGTGCVSTNGGQRFDENWAYLPVTFPRQLADVSCSEPCVFGQ